MAYLYPTFMNTKPGTLADSLVWRIYEKSSKRKLSDNYGAERGDLFFDHYCIYSMIVRQSKHGEKYLRVSVYDPFDFKL